MTNVATEMRDDKTSELSPRAARSRQKMIEAATELLVNTGSRSVTVDAVSEVSGVAKSTLYRHWSSRTELLIDVIESSATVFERPDHRLGFEAALRSLLVSVAETFGDPEWIRIFPSVASLRMSIPELNQFFEDDIADKKQAFGEVFDLGIAEGVLPDVIDLEDAFSLLLGPILFAALAFPGDRGSASELIRLADHAVDRFIASYVQHLER